MTTYGIDGDGDVVTLTVGKGIGDPARDCDVFTVNFLLMRVWNKVTETDYPAIVEDLNARELKPLALYVNSPEELRLGRALTHVKFLILGSGRDFTAADAAMVLKFPGLESLQICALFSDDVLTAVCDAAGRCQSLTDFYIDSSTVTDACVAGIAKSKSISELMFRTRQVEVTDAGLELLGTMQSLTRLRLESKRITSKGLRHLEALPALRNLRLHDEQAEVLRAGIDALLAVNPKCTIQCGSKKFKAKAATRAAKATAPKNPKPLSAKVWKEIERLGGKKRKIRENADGLPSPIEEFAHGIAWPKRKYSATLDLDGPFPVQDINFNVSGGTDEFAAFPSCEGRSLVKVGEASSCYYIALDFKSKNLSDPTLEMFDCEDFDEECMYHTQPLSKFLARLRVD